MTTRLLEKKEELELARSWLENGCQRSRAKIVTAYQPMIKNIARKHMRNGLSRDDLIQEGTIGFLSGLDNFDPSTGYSIGTLARWHVAARMQLHIAEFIGVLRLPNSRRIKGLISKCVGKIRCKENEIGRQLSDIEKSEICKDAGFSLDELHEYERAIRPAKSFSAPVYDDENVHELEDTKTTTEGMLSSQSVTQAAGLLKIAIKNLPERTQSIIAMRHLSCDFNSLESIAEKVGISRERVRRIELDALQKIKLDLEKSGIADLSDIF
jgi:RNA polymerase sigma factor (sigma-70 family)